MDTQPDLSPDPEEATREQLKRRHRCVALAALQAGIAVAELLDGIAVAEEAHARQVAAARTHLRIVR